MSRLKWFLFVLVGGVLIGVGWTHAQQRTSTKFTVDDYIAIQQLYASYNHAVDFSKNPADVADLFTDDAENGPALPGGLRWGRKGLLDYFQQRLERPTDATKDRHWNSNLLIKPTPEGAHGSVMLMVVRVGNPPTLTSTMTYEDDLVKTRQGWKFKKRVFVRRPGE